MLNHDTSQGECQLFCAGNKRSKHWDNATAITAVYTSQLIQSMSKSVFVLHP